MGAYVCTLGDGACQSAKAGTAQGAKASFNMPNSQQNQSKPLSNQALCMAERA